MVGIRRSAIVGALLVPGALAAQVFDNGSIIALHRAGLGEAAIVAKVESLPCGFDVSTDAMIALKRAGISDAVIAAMVRRCDASHRARGASMTAADPREAHAPGIYVARPGDPTAPMRLLRPSKASSIKVSGNGSLIWPFVGRLVMPEGQSNLAIAEHRPVFYFYFSTNERGAGDFGTPSAAAQSPDEFSLIRFKVKGNEREVPIGRISAFAARNGIDVKETIRFEASELDPSSFRVEPKAELAPGEYAFVLTGANNSARVYDFTVR